MTGQMTLTTKYPRNYKLQASGQQNLI